MPRHDRKPEHRQDRKFSKPPHKQAPKVLNDPTREPVNRGAASMFFKSNWLTAMPPERSQVENIVDLKLKIGLLERKVEALKVENASLRKQLGKRSITPKPIPETPKPSEPEPPQADNSKRELLEKLKNLK